MSTIDPPVAVEVRWEGEWWPGLAIFRQLTPEGWRYTVEFSTGLMENRRAWALFPNDIRLRDIDE